MAGLILKLLRKLRSAVKAKRRSKTYGYKVYFHDWKGKYNDIY